MSGQPEWVSAIRRWYEGYGPSAVDALEPLLAPSFVWIPPGRDNPLQDTYRGAAGMRRFLAAMGEWSDSVDPTVLDFLSDDRYLVAIVEASARRARDGREESWQFVHRWRAEEGLIVEFRAFVDDQARYDDFYALPDPAQAPLRASRRRRLRGRRPRWRG